MFVSYLDESLPILDNNTLDDIIMLLSINIPTYERLESFYLVLGKLVQEVCSLDNPTKDSVQINIRDNDSKCYIEKVTFCDKLIREFNVLIKISKNDFNDGGHLNVHNCYVSTPESIFTWVLGDDDHVLGGSLKYIINILSKHEHDLGLLILSGGYKIHSEILKPEFFPTYFDLARIAVKVQPHYLIAHTLISCNVYRTSCFDPSESLYTINRLYSRYGHWTGFPHMRGLVAGLLRSEKIVIVSDEQTLDVNHRVDDVDIGLLIFDIYYFYFLWLLVEIGVRPDQIERQRDMHWFFRGFMFQASTFRRRLNIKQRAKQWITSLRSSRY
ncbi:MAG: hypothetical protein K9J47_12085 [Sulfuritalea sp.]|nr:hypothetical protein [Sulfuritalea sp.]